MNLDWFSLSTRSVLITAVIFVSSQSFALERLSRTLPTKGSFNEKESTVFGYFLRQYRQQMGDTSLQLDMELIGGPLNNHIETILEGEIILIHLISRLSLYLPTVAQSIAKSHTMLKSGADVTSYMQTHKLSANMYRYPIDWAAWRFNYLVFEAGFLSTGTAANTIALLASKYLELDPEKIVNSLMGNKIDDKSIPLDTLDLLQKLKDHFKVNRYQVNALDYERKNTLEVKKQRLVIDLGLTSDLICGHIEDSSWLNTSPELSGSHGLYTATWDIKVNGTSQNLKSYQNKTLRISAEYPQGLAKDAGWAITKVELYLKSLAYKSLIQGKKLSNAERDPAPWLNLNSYMPEVCLTVTKQGSKLTGKTTSVHLNLVNALGFQNADLSMSIMLENYQNSKNWLKEISQRVMNRYRNGNIDQARYDQFSSEINQVYLAITKQIQDLEKFGPPQVNKNARSRQTIAIGYPIEANIWDIKVTN